MTTTIPTNQAQGIAVTSTYLWNGFRGQHLAVEDNDTYDLHSDDHGGECGIITGLWEYAEFLETLTNTEKYSEVGYPGSFLYEVVEDKLGAWLYNHPEHFSTWHVTEKFKDHTIAVFDSWLGLSLTPAKATPESSSTMTVAQLIAALSGLDQSLPVLTRGSEAQKMVDALEVRTVKTAARRAVFIGKPKAQAS